MKGENQPSKAALRPPQEHTHTQNNTQIFLKENISNNERLFWLCFIPDHSTSPIKTLPYFLSLCCLSQHLPHSATEQFGHLLVAEREGVMPTVTATVGVTLFIWFYLEAAYGEAEGSTEMRK